MTATHPSLAGAHQATPKSTGSPEAVTPWALEWFKPVDVTSSELYPPVGASALQPLGLRGDYEVLPRKSVAETAFLSSSALEPLLSDVLHQFAHLSFQLAATWKAVGSRSALDIASTSTVIQFKTIHASAADLVDQVRGWTALPMEEVADLLDVSRRTVYSWREGKQPRPLTSARLSTLATALRPLAVYFAPGQIRSWLKFGETSSPFELARGGDLAAFHEAAQEFAAKLQPPSEIKAPGRFVGSGKARVFELAGDGEVELVLSRPQSRPEPLDWDF